MTSIKRCKECSKKYMRQYYKRQNVIEHRKAYMQQYKLTPQYQKYLRYISTNPQYQIANLLKSYNAKLKKINNQIRRDWIVPPTIISERQQQFCNIINNLKLMHSYLISMSKTTTTDEQIQMFNKLESINDGTIAWESIQHALMIYVTKTVDGIFIERLNISVP